MNRKKKSKVTVVFSTNIKSNHFCSLIQFCQPSKMHLYQIGALKTKTCAKHIKQKLTHKKALIMILRDLQFPA